MKLNAKILLIASAILWALSYTPVGELGGGVVKPMGAVLFVLFALTYFVNQLVPEMDEAELASFRATEGKPQDEPVQTAATRTAPAEATRPLKHAYASH